MLRLREPGSDYVQSADRHRALPRERGLEAAGTSVYRWGGRIRGSVLL